jgi:DNA invertase Pin-like site-specific DNA recombinase
MRKALVQIQGIFAELDRSMIINKLNKGRIAKKAAGGKAEGRYPYGCDPHRPEETPVLAEIRALKASGSTTEQIAAILNEKGIRGRSGCIWRQPTVAKILRRAQT